MRRLQWWWACLFLKAAAGRMRSRQYPSLNRIADDIDRIRFGIERLRREYRTEAEDLRRPGWNEAKERASEELARPREP